VDTTRASATALATSLMRAVHTRLDRPPLIEDAWGDRLALEAERQAVAELALHGVDPVTRARIETLGSPHAVLDAALHAHPGYGWAIVRTRYTEDALEAAVWRGVRQYVVLGAGLDSFALRQPAFAREVAIFEIDHPATQDLKRQRLRDRGVAVPRTLHFVPADLSQEELGTALARSAFRGTESAFFSWLGVTNYLTREANLATLQAIARCSAEGSELVFTYIDRRELGPDRESPDLGRVQDTVASAGEPWLSGFDPAQLAEDLRAVGLVLVEDLSGQEARERYCRDRRDGLSPAAAFHIAHAQVGEPAGRGV
jgi:methyltransferase (TIGR00027 family)